MSREAARRRRTKELVQLAEERFSGCRVCRRRDSFDCIDDVLSPLRLRKQERNRLFRVLTCPACELPVYPGAFVLGASRERLRQAMLSKKFGRLHKQELEEFQVMLLRRPMLGADQRTWGL